MRLSVNFEVKSLEKMRIIIKKEKKIENLDINMLVRQTEACLSAQKNTLKILKIYTIGATC